MSVFTFIAAILIWKVAIHCYPHEFGETPVGAKTAPEAPAGSKGHLFSKFLKMQLIAEPLTGWDEAISRFDSLYHKDLENGLISNGTPIITHKWQGAQIDYYFCKKAGRQMIGLGTMDQLHEYVWMNRRKVRHVNLASAYFVTTELVDARGAFKNYYSHIDSITTIKAERGLRPTLNVYVYRLTGWKSSPPLLK
jgi:hypothetical protein